MFIITGRGIPCVLHLIPSSSRALSSHGQYWCSERTTSCPLSRSIVPRIHKLRSPIAEISELWKVASFKPGGGQNIAFHASPAARNYGFVISVLVAHSASFLSFLFSKCRVSWTVNCDVNLLSDDVFMTFSWDLMTFLIFTCDLIFLTFTCHLMNFGFWSLFEIWWRDTILMSACSLVIRWSVFMTFIRDLIICASDVLLVIWLLMSTKVCPSHLTVC